MKRNTPEPFGIHTGVIDSNGKLIFENEETGSRYLYFSNNDKIEKRTEIDIKSDKLHNNIKELIKKLPARARPD